MLKEDLDYLGAEDLHKLQRAWELQHRVLASEAVTQHTMFRTATRWPGYYYRADHPKLDGSNWHCFTLSRYDRHSDKCELERRPSTTSSISRSFAGYGHSIQDRAGEGSGHSQSCLMAVELLGRTVFNLILGTEILERVIS